MLNAEEVIYVDPLSDFGFKRIFGSEPHKVLLLSFLNEIFEVRKPVFEKLFAIAAYVNLSREDKTMYDVRLKRIWDEQGARRALINDVKAEMAAELEQAKSEVEEAKLEVRKAHAEVQAAKVKALEEGKVMEALHVARKLKVLGMDISTIAQVTDLSLEQLEGL